MDRLLVLSAGPSDEIRSLQADFAAPLAAALGWHWNGLWANLQTTDQPHVQLGALGDTTQAQALGISETRQLLGLPLDPGLFLPSGGHWAEAIGAWRQPAILVLSAAQCETGLPAAMAALLGQWQVPLVGLVQWGLPWEPEQRKNDGLPWLGICRPEQQTDETMAAAGLRSAFGWALSSRLGP